MIRHKLLWITTAMAVLLMIGCGKKQSETSEETSTTTEPGGGTPVDQATVGEVSGKVTFQGSKPKLALIHMDQDPVCVQKHSGQPVHVEDGEVNEDGTLPNVFVYVKEGADKYSFPAPPGPANLDQQGCMYKPHVLGLVAGQDLHIISSDPTTHNIHPMPKDNPEWNSSQAPGAAPLDKKFPRSEVMIPVKCNQHPWMRAYLGVVKTPLFSVTGSDGTFSIKGVPPGDYTIEAWTATFGAQEQKVTVAPKETKTLDFSFKPS